MSVDTRDTHQGRDYLPAPGPSFSIQNRRADYKDLVISINIREAIVLQNISNFHFEFPLFFSLYVSSLLVELKLKCFFQKISLKV